MKSKIALSFSFFILITAALFCPRWEKQAGESTLGWDVGGYYWYLPSLFIYQDIEKQTFADTIIQKYQFTPEFGYSSIASNGNHVLKYSSGMAVMYAPFFFTAHLITPFTDYPADGFSKPYLMAISFGSLLIAFIGLYFFRKLLLRYYSDAVVAITILLLVLGSNYTDYAAIGGALSHNWLFTVYVFILLATDNFYRTYKTKYAVAIGLLCGLATLTRPTDIISILIPVLWGIESLSSRSFTDRIKFFKNHFKKILTAILCFIVLVSIQIIYWKAVSGSWLYYSYDDQGFSWLHPHFFDYALSIRSGWMIYTPLAFFIVLGIVPFIKNGKNRVAIILFSLINFYIVSAWDIWWYAGTGGRAMIQSYPVIFFFLASLMHFLLKHKKWLAAATPFLLLCIYINCWITIQAHGGAGLYDSESMMKKEYFWNVIGRWQVDENIMKYKDTNELFEGKPASQKILYNATNKECLNKDIQNSSFHTIKINTDTNHWLRAEAVFYTPQKEWNVWKMTKFIIQLKKGDSIVKEKSIRLHRFLWDGGTKKISVDIKLPNTEIDSVSTHIWNAESDKEICMDSLYIYELR